MKKFNQIQQEKKDTQNEYSVIKKFGNNSDDKIHKEDLIHETNLQEKGLKQY